MNKIKQLEQLTGLTDLELIEEGVMEGIAAGICMNPQCDYQTEVEPDQDQGYCEECDTNTVQSILILSEMI